MTTSKMSQSNPFEIELIGVAPNSSYPWAVNIKAISIVVKAPHRTKGTKFAGILPSFRWPFLDSMIAKRLAKISKNPLFLAKLGIMGRESSGIVAAVDSKTISPNMIRMFRERYLGELADETTGSSSFRVATFSNYRSFRVGAMHLRHPRVE